MSARPSRKRRAPARLDSESTRKANRGERPSNKDRGGHAQQDQTGLADAVKSLQQQVTVLSQTVSDLVQPTTLPVQQPSDQGEAHSQNPSVECQDGRDSDHPVGPQHASPSSLGLLDQKTKSKIWSKQFIDLETLTSPTKETGTLSLQQGSSVPAFSVNERATRRIENIAQWTTAFLAYTGVYLERHQAEGASIIQYMQQNRSMATSLPVTSWKQYDEQFRKYRATTEHPWHTKHQDVYLEAVMLAQVGNFRHQSGKPSFRRFPRGQSPIRKGFWCQFCRNGMCPRDDCRFFYSCPTCNGKRPMSKCPKDARDQKGPEHRRPGTTKTATPNKD